jgi:hypothetical protein
MLGISQSIADSGRVSGSIISGFTAEISGLLAPGAELEPANRFSENASMSAILRSLLTAGRDASKEETDKTPKIALLRTYEGKIVVQPVKGLEKIDSFTYIFNVTTGLLTCHLSNSIADIFNVNPRFKEQVNRSISRLS